MKAKKVFEKSIILIKKRKYYIAVSLCIIAVGVIGLISYQNAKKIWDDTALPQQNAVDTNDVAAPQTDITDNAATVSKPTKQPQSNKESSVKPYILPVDGEVEVGYSAETPVYSKTLKDWRVHTGVDYIVPHGTKVKAVNDGVVESIVTDNLMGVTVTIKHTDGHKSIYSNLEPELNLKKDQLINQGDTVGKVGKSAIIEISQEPHLHFEMESNGKTIDPLSIYGK